mgnify:CR=1 FL=1|tara:strand:+ start:10460 stop:11269 length:810 start_codon:yes stop_codon:yes gene_type:complete
MKKFKKLENNGFQIFRGFFDKNLIKNLHTSIKGRSGTRFYNSLKKFKKNGRFLKTNPDLKFNYLNNFDTSFIDKKLKKIINGKIISKKIVHNVNKEFLPNWLIKYSNYIKGNLNPYIKKEYQNETHFFGTDIHQDLLGDIDEFITAYIYLDEVKIKNAPIEIYENTHLLGKSKFPFFLRKINNKMIYSNNGNTCFTKKKIILGNTGDLILFNARTLHATDINRSNKNRISLRYIIRPKKGIIKKKILQTSKHITFGMKDDHLQLVGRFD